MGTDKLQDVAEITKVNFGIQPVMQLGVNAKNYIYYIEIECKENTDEKNNIKCNT